MNSFEIRKSFWGDVLLERHVLIRNFSPDYHSQETPFLEKAKR